MNLLKENSVLLRIFKINLKFKKIKMSSSVSKIDTFVFFDLETSDLIQGKKMPKITELSMVAVARNSIKPDTGNKLALPRIMHKLTIPICPMESINFNASRVSNLWNNTLEDIKPFDENTYNLIMQFIERLPGLVCFVAHNGNNFDYPVFMSEIKQLDKIFPNNILCIDTLLAFREILSKIQTKTEEQIQIVSEGYDEVDKKTATIFKKESKVSLDDSWNDALSSILDNYEKGSTTKNEHVAQLPCENDKDVLDTVSNKSQKISSSPSRLGTPDNCLKSMQAINEKTPESQIIRTSHSQKISSNYKNLDSVKKRLYITDHKPNNFKLSTIYKFVIGCEAENQHCAEADCITILRCACQIAPDFIEWADCNAKPLINFLKNK